MNTAIDSTQLKINLYSSKLSWYPQDKAFLLERGKLFLQTAKYDSAVADFSICYKKDSFNEEVKKLLANALCERDRIVSTLGNYNSESVKLSLSLDSNCKCVLLNIGSYYLFSHKTDSALLYLQNHLQDTFSQKTLVTEIIGKYFYNDSNYTEAIKYLSNSQQPEFISMAALSNYYLGNYAVALNQFSKIPDSLMVQNEILFARGKCYQKTGQLSSALSDFKQLQKSGYEENHFVSEMRITQAANFISKSWYYVLALFITAVVLFVVLWQFLKK